VGYSVIDKFMIYYSFYLDKEKTKMVYRTTTGHSTIINDLFDVENTTPKTFDTEHSAKMDFYSLLFDNPEYRLSEIFGLKPGKKREVNKKPGIITAAPKIEHPIYVGIERNTVYNEKCEVTMARMPNNFVDYIITSPPYNAEETYKDGERVSMYEMYQDNMSEKEYEEWLFSIIQECIRVTRMHVFFNIQMLGNNKRTVLRLFGHFADQIKDRMVWTKSIVAPHIQPGVMNSGFEDIIIFSKDRPHLKAFSDAKWNQGSFSNVLKGVNASQNKHAKLNKATFPLYFPRTILNFWGAKGDLVYDPFNGTGTTGDACVIEKFDYIGSEIDPKQCQVTNERIKNQSAKLSFNF
jgi:DNA modification methylase